MSLVEGSTDLAETKTQWIAGQFAFLPKPFRKRLLGNLGAFNLAGSFELWPAPSARGVK